MAHFVTNKIAYSFDSDGVVISVDFNGHQCSITVSTEALQDAAGGEPTNEPGRLVEIARDNEAAIILAVMAKVLGSDVDEEDAEEQLGQMIAEGNFGGTRIDQGEIASGY